MKIVALIVNFFLPGVGSMLLGYIGTGIVQLVLYGIGAALALLGPLWLIGAPICLVVLVWSLITAATHRDEKERIVYVERDQLR